VLLCNLALLRTDVRAFFSGQALRIAAQRDDDAVLDFQILVVVEAQALVLDSVADEHQRRREIHLALSWTDADHDVVRVLETLLAARPGRGIENRERALVRAVRGFLERHLLKPAALGTARRQAVGIELGGNVARGDLVPARTGIPAFEQVVREEGHVRAKALGRE
jgi:hypothetical protein